MPDGYSRVKDSENTAGGAAIEAQANALAEVFNEMYDIYWHCENGHRFGQRQVRSPSKCSVCSSRLIDCVMTRRDKPPEKKKEPFKLSPLEQEALARIS